MADRGARTARRGSRERGYGTLGVVTRVIPALIVLLFSSTLGTTRTAPPQGGSADARASLHAAIDPVIDALWSGFDETAAMGHVRFISQYLAAARQHRL